MFNNNDLKQIYDRINDNTAYLQNISENTDYLQDINDNTAYLQNIKDNTNYLINIRDGINVLNQKSFFKDIKEISVPLITQSVTVISINEPTTVFIRILYFEMLEFKLNNGITNSDIVFSCDTYNFPFFFYHKNTNPNNVYNYYLTSNETSGTGNKPNTFILTGNKNIVLKNNNPKKSINFNIINVSSNSKIRCVYEILY